MTDIFLTEDLERLIAEKKVVFIGDSNVRSYYKDILCLLNDSQIISQKTLIAKMEKSVYKDQLQKHSEKTNSRCYQEERTFKSNKHHISFYFITRVYNEYVEEVLQKMVQDKQPDVLIINSCLWDMARWGAKGVEEYKANLVKLMKRLDEILDENCLVIWVTAPPLSQKPRGGFLLVELDFLKYCLRFHVMEANAYAAKVVKSHGYDVLDVHYHLRMQLQRRCPDGVHWSPLAVRYITNMLLTHISLSWDVPLPQRFKSVVTQRTLQTICSNSEEVVEKVPFATSSEEKEVCTVKAPLSVSKNKKKKKKKGIGKSYHSFINAQRVARAHQNIRSWNVNASREPCPSTFPQKPPGLLPVPSRFVYRSNEDWYNSDLPRGCYF